MSTQPAYLYTPLLITTLPHAVYALQTPTCCLLLVFALPLPPAVLVLQPPQSGTHSHLAFATLPLPIPFVTFFRLTASSRPSAPPSDSPPVPHLRPLADIAHSKYSVTCLLTKNVISSQDVVQLVVRLVVEQVHNKSSKQWNLCFTLCWRAYMYTDCCLVMVAISIATCLAAT